MRARIRRVWNEIHDSTMLFALVLWLCGLPFVLLLVVPWLGWQVGLLGAAFTFMVTLLACYVLCIVPKITAGEELNAHRPRLR